MTSGCGAIWSDAEKENSWSMNRNRKPENFLDPTDICSASATMFMYIYVQYMLRMLMVGGLLFSELDSASF